MSVLVQLLDARDRAVPIQSSIAGNIISVLYQGKDQKTVGRYKLVLYENKGEASMATIDHADAFELVPESRMAAGCSCMDVDLFSNIEAGIPGRDGEDAKINGHNAVEIVAGENVEIHQEGNVLTIGATGGGGGAKPYKSIRRLGEYLYEMTFAQLPQYVPSNTAPVAGCTSFVRDGRLYRNLDWMYDETPSFIVRTKDFEGMAFNSAVNDSSMSDTALGQLPYMVVDGVNRYGIMGSVHVLYNDFDWHGNGSIPLTKALYEILTRVTSMQSIQAELSPVIGDLATTPALDEAEYLLQFVITDGVTTYLLTPTSSGYELVNITANPKLTNFKWVADAEVERDAANMQLRPTGVERWNLIGEDTELSDLRFTKCYESADRLSEFVGIDDTTKDSTDAELTTVYNLAHTAYSTRTRNGQLWQTMHSVVYGENGMEHLWCQEKWDKDYVAQGGGGGEFEQVNSDWEATSGKARILNKPFYSKPGNKVFEINGETAFLVTSGMENWIYGYHSMVLPWSLNTEVTVTIDGHTVNAKLHSGIIYYGGMMPLIGNLEAARAMLYFTLSGMAGGMIPVATSLSGVKSLLEEGEPLFMGNISLSGSGGGVPFIIVNTNVIDIESESSITININGHTQTVGIEQLNTEEDFEGIAFCILDSLILYPEIPACDVYLDGEVWHLKCCPMDKGGPASEGPVLTVPISGFDDIFELCLLGVCLDSVGIELLRVTHNPVASVRSVSVYGGNVRTAYFGNVFNYENDRGDYFEIMTVAEAFGRSAYVAVGDSLWRYTPEMKVLWMSEHGYNECYGYEIGTAPRKLAFESLELFPYVSLCAFTDTVNRGSIAVYECDEKLLPSHSVVHERQRAIFDDYAYAIRIEHPGEAVLFGCGFRISDMPAVFYCGNAVDVVGTDEDDYDGDPYNGIVFTPVDRDTVIAKRMFGINDECTHMHLGTNLMPMTFTTFVDDGRNTPSRIKIVSYKTTPPNIQYCRDLDQYDEVLGEYVVRNNWVDLKFHKNADNQWESEELSFFSKESSSGDGGGIVKCNISFRGDNPNGLTEIVNGEHKTTRFVIEGECVAYGMPLSLLSKDFSVSSVPYAGFESLFEDCSGIVGADFGFWCQNVGSYACYRMFKNSGLEFYFNGDMIIWVDFGYCGEFAFAEMFEGSNLVELYPTPIAGRNSAYRMLADCDNLQCFYLSEPPREDSYKEIAAGCGNLQEVCLVGDFTDWKDGIGTKDWLKDTPSTGTLYCSEELGTDETIERGADYCPEGWTVDNNIN